MSNASCNLHVRISGISYAIIGAARDCNFVLFCSSWPCTCMIVNIFLGCPLHDVVNVFKIVSFRLFALRAEPTRSFRSVPSIECARNKRFEFAFVIYSVIFEMEILSYFLPHLTTFLFLAGYV